MAANELSTGRLILRCLTPSSVSLTLCLMVGFMVTMSHIVLLSVSYGTALPGFLDGQWASAYTENVVQPLHDFFRNATFNKLAVAMMWGTVGLIIYLGFEYAFHTYRSAKEAQEEVALNKNGHYQHNPQRQFFIRDLIWRSSVLIGGIIIFILALPMLRYAMQLTPEVVASQSLAKDGPNVLVATLLWALFFQGMVVLIRLYTMRTRIFGDESLY